MSGEKGHLVVSGRWDDNVAIIDVAKALKPENDGSPTAVICRPRVTPDIDSDGDGRVDAKASGQPVAVVVDHRAEYAYVVNHSGPATPEAATRFQHGHPGLIAVVNIRAAIDPATNGTLDAIEAFVPTGRTGPVGCALTPDGQTLLVNCGEAEGSEDGGDEITAIDVASRTVSRRIPLKLARRHPATAPSAEDLKTSFTSAIPTISSRNSGDSNPLIALLTSSIAS